MTDLLAGLDPGQVDAATHDEGPALVAAVAGSGKTLALTRRIAYLVQHRGVASARVLALAFNAEAAATMQTRAEALVPGLRARIGTFHSLAFEIARNEVRGLAEWRVDARNEYRFCIKDAIGYQGMRWGQADVTWLAHLFAYAKNELARPGSDRFKELTKAAYARRPGPTTDPRRVQEAYERTEELRRERLLLTFDDMLLEACTVLADETVRQRWANRYDRVLLDEGQDRNTAQEFLGEALARDHRNYMLIGDPGQAIYSWRGALPARLVAFAAEWGARIIRLERNYRSARAIVNTANAVLEAMPPATRLDVTLQATRATDGDIVATRYRTFDDEAHGVVRRIQELRADGADWSDIAVLYRTNAQSRAPEEYLISHRIPYRVIGGTNFYVRREVTDLLAYLRVLRGGTLDAATRSLGAPMRYLGKKFTDRLAVAAAATPEPDWPALVRATADALPSLNTGQVHAAHTWASLIESLRQSDAAGTPPARLLDTIISATGYTRWLLNEEGTESTENNRISNVRELVRAAGRFRTSAELLRYVSLTALNSQRNAKQPKPNAVTLSSIHVAKGLEWPAVFVLGCNELVLPHVHGDVDEERRLFYVATTRARDMLFYSCIAEAMLSHGRAELDPSRFLAEAGVTVLDAEAGPAESEPPPQPDPVNEDLPF